MKPDFNLDSNSRDTPVEKEVIYFDFRGELSAFDKYFHFYKSKNDKLRRKFEQKRGESKEYIQRKSGFLMKRKGLYIHNIQRMYYMIKWK